MPMLILCDSHKDVREMEYELFRSKLKPLVDRTLIPNIIESSSSGEHPHHAVAMGLILERSIQERRERMSKTTNASQPDSTSSQAERNTETPSVPIRQAQPVASVPPPQSLSQSSASLNLTSASAKTKASPDSLTPSGSGKVGPPGKPPAKTTTNPSRGHTVGLKCIYCAMGNCSLHSINRPGGVLNCAGCGTELVGDARACTNCNGKSKR